MELLEERPEILEQVEVMWVDAGYDGDRFVWFELKNEISTHDILQKWVFQFMLHFWYSSFFTNNDYRIGDERRDTSDARIPPFGLIIIMIQLRFE